MRDGQGRAHLHSIGASMKITAIEAVPFHLVPRRDFKWAGLQGDLGRFVLVRVRTDEGLTGYGEATPQPDWGGDFGRRGGETQRTVIAVIDKILAPALLGHSATDINAAVAVMNGVLVGHNYAKCAIDIALHDILGKSLGVPIWKILGGKVRDAVPVAHMVGIMPDEEAVAEAQAAITDGVTTLQIKGGKDPDRDIRLIARLRQVLGDAVTLRLDVNQGYRHVKTAIAVVSSLRDSGLDFIEQPAIGMRDMAEVTRSVEVPVIADESCWDAADALDIVSERAADCISIYLAKAGGITGARKVAAIAEAAGLRCDVNGSIESAIGNAANLHFALATACVQLPAVIPFSAPKGRHSTKIAGSYYEDDVVTEPFPVADGALHPLNRPGLGIEVDEQKLKRFIDR